MNIEQIVSEFNSIKYLEEIYTEDDWSGDWNSKNAILLICTEFWCADQDEVKKCCFHYYYKYFGSKEFNEWLERHRLEFEWYNECIAYVFRSSDSECDAVEIVA